MSELQKKPGHGHGRRLLERLEARPPGALHALQVRPLALPRAAGRREVLGQHGLLSLPRQILQPRLVLFGRADHKAPQPPEQLQAIAEQGVDLPVDEVTPVGLLGRVQRQPVVEEGAEADLAAHALRRDAREEVEELLQHRVRVPVEAAQQHDEEAAQERVHPPLRIEQGPRNSPLLLGVLEIELPKGVIHRIHKGHPRVGLEGGPQLAGRDGHQKRGAREALKGFHVLRLLPPLRLHLQGQLGLELLCPLPPALLFL
mmetsp:Transcript_43938/g.127052  ORF Transcript_43938/g.127052 Transcript_43938/m.127052 type:complete len:258 (-) Transcript_43938:32-805(-)